MPNFGKKPGGSAKAAGNSKGRNMGVSKKNHRPPSMSNMPADDDMPLDSQVAYEDDAYEDEGASVSVSVAEPFEDGLVSAGLRNLPIVPRVGGEEVSILHDFLVLFSKTETFIGAISSKTSFMKKTGGRLL